MFFWRHLRGACFAALALLAIAEALHAYGHWEAATHAECHTRADDHHDGDSPLHDHGLSSHDHAPAVAGNVLTLIVSEAIAPFASVRVHAPDGRAVSIDHPPQLS
jgi:hypothetical protein